MQGQWDQWVTVHVASIGESLTALDSQEPHEPQPVCSVCSVCSKPPTATYCNLTRVQRVSNSCPTVGEPVQFACFHLCHQRMSDVGVHVLNTTVKDRKACWLQHDHFMSKSMSVNRMNTDALRLWSIWSICSITSQGQAAILLFFSVLGRIRSSEWVRNLSLILVKQVTPSSWHGFILQHIIIYPHIIRLMQPSDSGIPSSSSSSSNSGSASLFSKAHLWQGIDGSGQPRR